MDIAKGILLLLIPAEKRKVAALATAIFCVALLDVVGVASIMPFMTVLTASEALAKVPLLAQALSAFGLESQRQVLLAMGCGVLLLLAANLAKAWTARLQVAFCEETSHALACRLLRSYLAQPYAFFLSRNTATLGANTLAETGGVTNGVTRPAKSLNGRVLAQGSYEEVLASSEAFRRLVRTGCRPSGNGEERT